MLHFYLPRTSVLVIAFIGCSLVPGMGLAQICQGSLGDPVVKIDFGSGNNPGPPLSQSLPNLTYTADGCPNDGFYTITNSIGNCYGGSWHTYTSDHTPGDVNGYMMLINASLNSGDFFVTTIAGLCPGTTYEFAAWVTNIFYQNAACGQYVKPNLRFTIESLTGTQLATYSTGDIPENPPPGQWKQYGLFFVTPANASSVVLRISNMGPGGCGNDLALDDITFRPCGPSVSISNTAGQTSASMCADKIATQSLNANISSGYNNPRYLWQRSTNGGNTWTDIGLPGTTTTLNYTPQSNGTTLLRLVAAEAPNIVSTACRTASNMYTITVHSLPNPAPTVTNPACEGSPIRLQASGAGSFSWMGPNGFTSNLAQLQLIATPAANGNYTVAVTDTNGCLGTASIPLVVVPGVNAAVMPDTTICSAQPTPLRAAGGTRYSWIPATGLSSSAIANPVATLSSNTQYTVIVANDAGCADTATLNITVVQSPTANAGPDKTIAEGQTVQLQGQAGGQNISWQWLPNIQMDSAFSLTPTVSPLQDQIYTLQVISANGCPMAEDQVFVRVFKKVVAPNAFSPNADGINDTWRIEALQAYPQSIVTIYDRYGRQVLQTPGPLLQWNGRLKGIPLSAGVYYYVIDLKAGEHPLIQGSVTLLR